ncbi:MAG: response regulator [Verrucomicrobiota bacterium]|nr:response regulator [Verrucomicrobiota bacterium]
MKSATAFPNSSMEQAEESREKSGGAPTTILVVDDSPTSRTWLTRTLETAGYRILGAADGAEALVKARAEHPDVVISDVLMPLVDGYEFARQLRADATIAATPIIFYTAGYEQEEARSLAHSCGVFHILTKPADPGKLLRTINAILSEGALPAAATARANNFHQEHLQLLTDKLSDKVAELEAALEESKSKEIRLRQTMEEIVKAEQALEQTNRHLLRKNQEIQNFYHTVSHELKTPLTSAREFVSIVMDGLAGPVSDTQREYLGIARESCNRLRVCINDLMDATRLETGKLSLEMKPGSLAGLIRQLITLLGPVAARKQITLGEEVQPDLPDFPFDENRLMQVLTNLVNNALKFTPDHGRVTITAAETPDHPGCVKVCVKDTGCGIAPAELERIFERLYQVPNDNGGSEQGVGLGLYISRELVQSHGGKIWVESELGKGSAFCFVIPKEQPSEAIHVLVVDDDPGIRETVSRSLKAEGFYVTTAENGSVALEKMKQETPELVIMDLKMPGRDGADTLKEIRQHWGALPVIIHTGFPDKAIMARAMEFSPFTLLAKPCPIMQLVQTIRNHQLRTERPARKRSDNPSGGNNRGMGKTAVNDGKLSRTTPT